MYVYRSNYLARSDHRNRKSVDAILGVIHEYRGVIHEYRGDIHEHRADIHEYRADIHLSCDIAILRDIARYS